MPSAVIFQPSNAFPFTEFSATPGKGLTGRIGSHTYYSGSVSWMQEMQKTFPSEVAERLTAWQEQAYSIVAVANETTIVALIALSDEVKSSSAAALSELHKMGIRTCILTGDNETTAAAVARSVGAGQYAARLLPADKAAFVRRLQHSGLTVAMVGDGINDSAALAQADLSVAIAAAATLPSKPPCSPFSRPTSCVCRKPSGYLIKRSEPFVRICLVAFSTMSSVYP